MRPHRVPAVRATPHTTTGSDLMTLTIAPPEPVYLGPAKFYGGEQRSPFKRIVIHCTVSPTERGGARNVARYFRQTVTRPSSCHYIVDPFEAVQVVGDHTVAFHAPPNGGLDGGTIGVELCDPQSGPADRWFDELHQRMLRRAARLVARLALAYDVPIEKLGPRDLVGGARGICGHVDVSYAWRQTSHTDPGDAFPWGLFFRLVREHAERLRGRALRELAEPRRVVFAAGDFGLRLRAVREDFAGFVNVADVVLGTEAKNVDLAEQVPALAEFEVHQDTSTKAKAGSYVAWRDDRVTAGRTGLSLGVSAGHARMLDRWLSWAVLDGLMYVAAHRPPLRYAYLWPAFDKALKALDADVIGIDANTTRARRYAETLGMSAHATAGVCTILTSSRVKVMSTERLEAGNSDHRPILAVVKAR